VKKSHIISIGILLLLGILISGCGTSAIKDGDTVSLDYTGTLTDGSMFDTSIGGEPLSFTMGAGNMIPGFEKAVLGMKVGDEKTVTIPSSEAYGSYSDNRIVEISRSQLGPEVVPVVGMELQAAQPDGSIAIVTIKKVSDTKVTIDTNHPLAGKDLTFKIKILKIE
jgi:peptidylprolyl isomerase